jgi:hypothetical protein
VIYFLILVEKKKPFLMPKLYSVQYKNLDKFYLEILNKLSASNF